MKHGSLFTGIGGFDLGFERAGIETVWTVEKDKNCNQVLAAHWPDVERHSDVKEVGKHNLAPVDVISGGFPCQDLSVAGRREGLAGKRSGLWFEFARIVGEMAPQWVVVENVPGLLSSAGGADFALILGTLEQLGYCVSWRVLDSQYFGVPQRRRRVFVVGSLGDVRAGEILFEPEGGEGGPAEGQKEGEGPAPPFGGGAGNAGRLGRRIFPPLVASLGIAGTGFCKDETLIADSETLVVDIGDGKGQANVSKNVSPPLTMSSAGHAILPDGAISFDWQ